MDIKTPEQCSKNMAAIRSKDTTPEIYFRKLIFAKGYRYSLNSKKVFGHPDVFLKKYNTAIFVNGCFWHRHRNCKHAYMPKTKVEFWQRKFENNIKRDNTVRNTLKEQGIKCLVIWECTLNKMKKEDSFRDEILESVEQFLVGTEDFIEL